MNDWAEYHAKYEFSDGAFTAERRLVVKKDKVPLIDWDKYLDFRRGIYADESRTEPILHAGRAEAGTTSTVIELGPSALQQEMIEHILQLRDAVNVLLTDQPQTAGKLASTATDSQNLVDAIESRSVTLSADDQHSLFWSQALAAGWCVRGWSALAVNDLPNAESYLRAAWNLNEDSSSGYLLGWALELKQERVAAARQYELAYVASAGDFFCGFPPQGADLHKRIQDGYKRVTGRELTATPLNHGSYEGSLQAELDKLIEIHQIVRTTKPSYREGFMRWNTNRASPARPCFSAAARDLKRWLRCFKRTDSRRCFPKGQRRDCCAKCGSSARPGRAAMRI